MNDFVNPKVELVAYTQQPAESPISDIMHEDTKATDPEILTEFAGRACYQSFGKPNPSTRRNADYLARTLHEQGHMSIAEHASASFYITGVSRAFTHELVRHRHLSYSQLSQRFVDESNARFVAPPAASDDSSLRGVLAGEAGAAVRAYEEIVDSLENLHDLPRKQAREAARAVLPNMTETRIVVTGNFRAWYEVIARRIAPDADAEFQAVAGLILDQLVGIAPSVFNNLKENHQ